MKLNIRICDLADWIPVCQQLEKLGVRWYDHDTTPDYHQDYWLLDENNSSLIVHDRLGGHLRYGDWNDHRRRFPDCEHLEAKEWLASFGLVAIDPELPAWLV